MVFGFQELAAGVGCGRGGGVGFGRAAFEGLDLLVEIGDGRAAEDDEEFFFAGLVVEEEGLFGGDLLNGARGDALGSGAGPGKERGPVAGGALRDDVEVAGLVGHEAEADVVAGVEDGAGGDLRVLAVGAAEQDRVAEAEAALGGADEVGGGAVAVCADQFDGGLGVGGLFADDAVVVGRRVGWRGLGFDGGGLMPGGVGGDGEEVAGGPEGVAWGGVVLLGAGGEQGGEGEQECDAVRHDLPLRILDRASVMKLELVVLVVSVVGSKVLRKQVLRFPLQRAKTAGRGPGLRSG